MRATLCWMFGGILGVSLWGLSRAAEAADPEVSISLEPIRHAFVSGDRDKFSAHHWMKDNYVGGVKEFSFNYALPDGTQFSTESHALIDQNDLGADVSLKKDSLGFFTLDYSEFRKYYDKTGGAYYPFTTLRSNDTFKDLALDIGKFGFETGLTIDGWPGLTLQYERKFKDGAKSRLTWTAVKEGTTTRNIGPSWQDIDEIVDTFAIKANHEIAGFSLKGEQRWEFVRTETLREEKLLATTGVASDTKIRRQDQAPEANLMTTQLEGERRFLNDKAFFASAYRFAHMENREFESIVESNAAGTVTNFSNPKQIRDARADNDYDTHAWVGNFMINPWNWLSVGTKLKAEAIHRESNSSYPADASPNSAGGSTPDGTIDSRVDSLNKNKAVRWGEGVSLRFFGIPRTALYTDLELEQSRVILAEDRKDLVTIPNVNEDFSRYTLTHVRRGTWTLGSHVAPWSFLDLTTQVRRRVNNNDYDDQRETVASGTALSAFVDMQNIHTDEFTTRATLRPCRWFRSSFRYQFRNDNYATRAEAQDTVKTGMLSNIYTFDVTAQPLQDLTTTASFSRQTAVTTTPAGSASSTNIPGFRANVNTWLFSADYSPRANVSVTHTLLYSRARNFNDFTASGMPFGTSFDQLDVTTGLKWALTEDTSVGTEYAFYSYLPHSLTEVGDYHAHVIWIELSKQF